MGRASRARKSAAAVPSPEDPLVVLARFRASRDELDRSQAFWMARALEDGQSWTAIGRALGVSRQAARQWWLRH